MICTERKMAIIFLIPGYKKTEGDTYNNLRLVQPETICLKKKGGGRVYISYCYLLKTQPVPGTKQMPQGLPTQKCSLRSSSINLTWKMVRNAESRAPPQLYRLRISKFPGESHTLKWDKMNGKIFYYVLTKAL